MWDFLGPAPALRRMCPFREIASSENSPKQKYLRRYTSCHGFGHFEFWALGKQVVGTLAWGCRTSRKGFGLGIIIEPSMNKSTYQSDVEETEPGTNTEYINYRSIKRTKRPLGGWAIALSRSGLLIRGLGRCHQEALQGNLTSSCTQSRANHQRLLAFYTFRGVEQDEPRNAYCWTPIDGHKNLNTTFGNS